MTQDKGHDFVKFPELTNGQMDFYYFESPHRQITEDFRAKVIKVIDGDTIEVRWTGRNFNFPIRFFGINAPEMNEGGKSAKDWLRNQIEGDEVDIGINKRNRVGKFGRLIGKVMHRGMDIGEWMLRDGRVTTFENRNEGKIPEVNNELSIKKWF